MIRSFTAAMSYFTVIPIPKSITVTGADLEKAMAFFPLIGFIIGSLQAILFYGLSLILPLEISVLIALFFGIGLTGALHEDGLGDFADGFWGAFEKERILEIMKDSRLGTYGTITIFFFLGLRWLSLTQLAQLSFFFVWPLAQCLSRLFALSVSWGLPNARQHHETVTSKSSFTNKLPSRSLPLVLTLILSCFLLPSLRIGLTLLVLGFILRALLQRYFLRKIGGYTGDCLGAAQQFSESLIYLVLVIG